MDAVFLRSCSAFHPKFQARSTLHILPLIILAACCAIQPTASAASLLTAEGVKVRVDFADPQQGFVLFVGALPAIPNLTLAGLSVNVNLGGFQRSYILNANGVAIRTPDLFELHDNGAGFDIMLNASDDDLATTFAPLGFVNQTVSNVAISMDVSLTFNAVTYSDTLTGTYDAMANNAGKAFLGAIKAPKNPFKPVVHITTLKATPNPTQANQAVTIKGIVSLADLTGKIVGHVHFGDLTPPIRAGGIKLQKMLQDGITHTYDTDGVYVARVTLVAENEIAATRLFIIVGSGFVVNSRKGGVSRLLKTGGGSVTLQLGIDNIPGAKNAQTTFLDISGKPIGAGTLPAVQMGLTVTYVFTQPGIYIAETIALDKNNKPIGTVRKTITISAADIGSSPAFEVAEEGAEQVTPRDTTTESAITLTSTTGKFLFTSSNSDRVVFNGTIPLPAGYTPKNSAGNDINISMGNVIDMVHLDSKAKLILPTAMSRITRFRLTPPRLPSGVALGGETAKVSIVMNFADLDILGFDSDGITVSVRADESGQSKVARFIQVNMLIAGQSYTTLAQVDYAPSSNSAFGTISGRSAK